MTVRVAMWSGPRNISTAMMRSWETRGDCAVVDEPLYAHYLAKTGLDHPGRDDILRAHETDERRVVDSLTGLVPGDKPVFYQKHMAHHLLSGMETGWVLGLTNVFLVREPGAMLASLLKVLPDADLDATGLPQQVRLFELVRAETGEAPQVIDADDVLSDPGGVLSELCNRIGVAYTDRMLRWEPGPRASDGVWAPHWYGSVEKSTGFERRERPEPELPDSCKPMLNECRRLYDTLIEHRIR